MKAPKPAPKDPIPAGNHVARLYQLIYLGTVPTTWKGEEKLLNKVRLNFELCNELKEFKEGEGERPYSIGQEFTFSMGPKANLRKFVEGMTGSKFTDEEAYGFDLDSVMGSACLLNVVHVESNGNTYANVQNASPLPKGMTAPKQYNDSKIYDVNTTSYAELDSLPDFITNKMYSSVEYKARVENEKSVLGLGDMPDDTGEADTEYEKSIEPLI